MTTDSRISDQEIGQHLPLPIAVAWHRVTLATTAEARVQRAVVAFEVALRTVVAVTLPDYLRGPPVPAVEAALAPLVRPALGHWLQLVRELIRALAARQEPEPFVAIPLDPWFDGRGRPGPALKAADAVIAVRNKLQHGSAGAAGWTAHAKEVVTDCRLVLASLGWLRDHRLLRVVDQAPTRKRTHRGHVQIFAGFQPLPVPVMVEFDDPLLPDAVYLVSPDGTRLLEVSPLFAMAIEPGVGEERLFLIKEIHKGGSVVLAWDETGATLQRRPSTDEGEITWSAWLDQRTHFDPVHTTRDHLRTLAAPHQVSDRAGELLADRFELRGVLGEGGMAVVHHAWDRLAGEDVALKVLKAELSGNPELRARFKREAATMRSVNSPRLLSAVELGELPDGELFLRMPLLSGGTVADRIANGPIPTEVARQWAEDLLEGLVHLEQVQIVHRDIKPSNLLLDGAGRLVLGDFGIALGETDARLTRTLQQLGSLAYMAPEHRGSGDTTSKSDVFSAALVLHEIVTGEPPGAVAGIDIGGTLGEVIRRMGVVDPDQRCTAASALTHLRDPYGGSMDTPQPSDDGRIAIVATVATLTASALLTGYGLSRQAPWVVGASSPNAVWLGWVVIAAVVTGTPIAAGATAGWWGHGDPRWNGGWAGLWSNLGAWSMAGASVALVGVSRPFLVAAMNGGAGIDEQQFTGMLSEPLLLGAWATWGGLLLAGLLGGLLGTVAGGTAGAFRPRSPVPTQPDDQLRMMAVVTQSMLTLVSLVVVLVALAALQKALYDAMQLSRAIAGDLLVGGVSLPVAFAACTQAGLQIVGWPLIARLWAKRHRSPVRARDHTNAARAIGYGLLLGALGLFTAWLLYESPIRLAVPMAAAVAAVTVGGAIWTGNARHAAAPPGLRWQPAERWVGGLAIAWLAVGISLNPPMVFGLGAALLVIVGIDPIIDGSPLLASDVLRHLDTLWRSGWMLMLGVLVVAQVMVAGSVVASAYDRWTDDTWTWRRAAAALGAHVALLSVCLVVFIVSVTRLPRPGHAAEGPAWAVPRPPGLTKKEAARRPFSETYLGGQEALLRMATFKARNALEGYTPIWLEAATVRSILRELDGIPRSGAWEDTRALALDHDGPLAEALRVWPEGTDAVLHQHPTLLEHDALAQVLHALLVADGDGHPAAPFTIPGDRLPLQYALAARAAAGPGVPTEAGLLAADAIFEEARHLAGRAPVQLRAERAWISLRAGQPRMAREMVTELTEVDLRHDLLAATTAATALRLGMRPLEERATAALVDVDEGTWITTGAVLRMAEAFASVGRVDEARSWLRRETELALGAGRKIDAMAFAHLDRELQLANGEATNLWDEQFPQEAVWALDACGQLGVRALAGEVRWDEVLAETGPCHHAGSHQVWRSIAAEVTE